MIPLIITEFIIFILSFPLLFLFRLLPNKMKFKMSEIVGVLLFYLVPKGRKLTYQNLNLILNNQNNMNLSKKELKRLAIKSYKHNAISFLLTFWIYDYLSEYKPIFKDLDLLMNLKQKHNRLVISNMHFGYFQVNSSLFLEDNLFIFLRSINNRFLESYIKKCRYNKNITFIPNNNIREFIKHKNSKGIFVTSNDTRNPLVGEHIIFFGLPTTTSIGPANFAKKENIPIIVLNNEVINNHICKISIDGIIYPSKYNSSKDILEEIIKLYEKRVISNPTQWFWFQDRWIDGK